MMASKAAIGINLGTTYSCVAVFEYDQTQVVANEYSSSTTPSFVYFKDKGEHVIGEDDKSPTVDKPANVVYDAKRLIGHSSVVQ